MQNFESGHVLTPHNGKALHHGAHFWCDLHKLVCTVHQATACKSKQWCCGSQYMGVGALAGGGGLRQPLPPNSLLSRVHFGFSQGRPVPGNFYNAPPVHCSALRLTALQFAPPLYWQTPTWLRHTTNAISPPHDATLCYFHAVLCYVGNTISPPLEYL